jgi:hypothetical protein
MEPAGKRWKTHRHGVAKRLGAVAQTGLSGFVTRSSQAEVI